MQQDQIRITMGKWWRIDHYDHELWLSSYMYHNQSKNSLVYPVTIHCKPKIPHVFFSWWFNDNIWDNSTFNHPIYLAPPFRDCKSQINFSNCQWCGKFWRANHSEFLLRIDDQNFDKCHIPIQQNWTPTHLQHTKLSCSLGLFGQHIPLSYVLHHDPHPHVHHSTIITIILNSPADASRRWGLLRVASLNCRSWGILGDLTDYSIGLLKGWGFWRIHQLDSV